MPEVGRINPAISMASVLLPQPDGPTMARNSPSRTSNDTPSSARTGPSGVGNTRTTSETSTNFSPLSMPRTAGIVLQKSPASLVAGSPLLPDPPDLLGRPSPRPLPRDEGEAPRAAALRCLQFDQRLDLEATGAEEADPVSVWQVELDRAVVRPLDAMHTEEVADQAVLGALGVVWGAEQAEQPALEEDELPAGAQEARRLGDPAVGIAPDARPVLGQHEVEAFRAQRRTLGVGVHEGEGEPVLALERPRVGELARRVVEPHHARPAAGEPGRPVGGATPELDHVPARDVGQGAEVPLADAPDAPDRLVARPGPPTGLEVFRAQPVPCFAVPPGVARGLGAHHRWP